MQAQLHFLKDQFIPLINQVGTPVQPKWGKMDFQQMLEHLTDFFQVSTQKQHFPLVSLPEHMPKLKEFLISDKPFRENTKAPVSIIGENPFPYRNTSVEEAKKELIAEVNYFFQLYTDEPDQTAVHPVFGELNFEEWVRLHYKHVIHHARQFGLIA
jgi:oxepin-CoA hydrolase/3-oxo-5,6-dehydrosuberyl-CoA semialdehyde dehydrogenase